MVPRTGSPSSSLKGCLEPSVTADWAHSSILNCSPLMAPSFKTRYLHEALNYTQKPLTVKILLPLYFLEQNSTVCTVHACSNLDHGTGSRAVSASEIASLNNQMHLYFPPLE